MISQNFSVCCNYRPEKEVGNYKSRYCFSSNLSSFSILRDRSWPVTPLPITHSMGGRKGWGSNLCRATTFPPTWVVEAGVENGKSFRLCPTPMHQQAQLHLCAIANHRNGARHSTQSRARRGRQVVKREPPSFS